MDYDVVMPLTFIAFLIILIVSVLPSAGSQRRE